MDPAADLAADPAVVHADHAEEDVDPAMDRMSADHAMPVDPVAAAIVDTLAARQLQLAMSKKGSPEHQDDRIEPIPISSSYSSNIREPQI